MPLRTPFAPTKIPPHRRSRHRHTTPYPTAADAAAARVNSRASPRVRFSRIQILTRSTKLGCRARSTTTRAPRTQHCRLHPPSAAAAAAAAAAPVHHPACAAAPALAPAASNYYGDDDDDHDYDGGGGGGGYDTNTTTTTTSTDAAALPRPHQPPRSRDHLGRAPRRWQ